MADSKKAVSPILREIEEYKKEYNISDVIFEGVKTANNWKNGKQVTKDEFEKACKKFLQSPIDGKIMNMEARG